MEEYRKSMYKERKQALTSHQHNRINRQLQEANRNKQRSEQFQLSRKISVSPASRIRQHTEKENVHEIGEDHHGEGGEAIANSSRTAKVVCTARDPEKIKKQEAFILRFLDWKDKKKSQLEQKKNEANKKRPFLSAVSKDTGFGIGSVALAPVTNHHATFVPKGHHQNFEPPAGLRSPEEIVKEKTKSRQSVYTLVPTPPKKTKGADESIVKKMRNIRKALPTNLHIRAGKTNFNNKTPARADVANKNARPLSSGPKSKIATSNSATKPATTAPNNLVKSLPNNNNVNVAATKTKTKPTTTNLKPKSLKMPPPATPTVKRLATAASGPNIRKPVIPAIKINNTGAKPKSTGTATNTRTTERTKQQQRLNKKSPQKPQKNARLTQTLKAKKPTKPPNSASTKLLTLMVSESNGIVSNMMVQTPKDFSSTNHFDEFVTSTKVKNAGQSLEDAKGISPIEMPLKRSLSNSSAKRNLLKETTTKMAQTQSQVENNDIVEQPTTTNFSRKFNFIRYSVANTTLNDEDDNGESDQKPEENAKEPNVLLDEEAEADRTLVVERSMAEERTPTKQPISSDDKPVNYLSPYVSVSRGKVSLKKEKEKRNSIYLVNPAEDELNCSVQTIAVSPQKSPSTSPQYSAEVRRTIEAGRYFRKQLQDETDRLLQQCNVWEEYKEANLEKLQSVNCDDMIDVTIGQTRLLTSKKFMQFKGLIDRCEARATGVGDVPNDGSEKTKDVDAVDLEGFWSMLGLQVDNLEKRFDNLNRWKANDWQDPDEVKPKPKPKPKNLTKVKKGTAPAARAKPNSALQQMLRKMQSEMRNKKANNLLATTDDVILTPSKVRDRKFYSPAATVVAIPASNRRLSSLLRQNAEDSPSRRMSLLVRKSSQDSPSRRMSLLVRKNSQDTPSRRTSLLARKNSQDSPSLLKSVLKFREVFDAKLVEESKSPDCTKTDSEAFNSPVSKSRKSILKTPGTAKSNLRNVVFNEILRVKKFNFMVNDEDADEAEDCNQSDEEEDLAQNRQDTDEVANEQDSVKLGTYSLRNRKVRLRPSCEIVIPK